VIYAFAEFELDTQLFELRRQGQPCPLEPQVFNVLRYLIEHADHVVSKEELLENLWPGRVVSESALTSRLKTARQILGDSGREQRLIKTLHGRGYRFIGSVERRAGAEPGRVEPAREAARGVAPTVPVSRAPAPVGREPEIALLDRHWQAAGAGNLQIVFIEGEAGLGKTTLIAAFLARVRAGADARVAVGQCVELGAGGEAYMPVLDALDALCRGPGGDEVVACLEDIAPTWLLQLPGLVGAEERQRIEQRVLGVTQERMLREFAAAARALGESRPLLLVLEDLHWCDPSTLALLAWLGRRNESIRLFILCSHRPGEAPEPARSLAETVYGLRLRGLARLIVLDPLEPAEITAYLEQRFPGCTIPRAVVETLHAHTEGNPLFLVSVVDSWVDRGMLVESADGWRLQAQDVRLFDLIPDTLRLLINDQLNRLAPLQRRLLEAGSAVGVRFPAALVEGLLAQEGEPCERELTELAEGSPFIARDSDAEWPDGTITSQFRFTHTLYRETLYAGLPVGRRTRMHAEIGERLERAYGAAAAEHAIELAIHFTAGGDYDRAAHYRFGAAQLAFGRGGYREAIAHLEQGLDLLARHPEIPEHDTRELGFHLLLAPALIQTSGWSESRAEAALERALALAEALDDPRLPSAIYLLAAIHELRGEYAQSQHWLERQHALPKPFASPLAKLESHELLACSLYHQGAFEQALVHAEAGLAAADVFDTESKLYLYGENPRVSCHNWAGLALWFLGFPERARARIEEGLVLARRPARKYSLSNALCQAATLYQLRREPARVLEFAQEAVAVAHEEGFTYPLAVGQILEGWALGTTGRVDEGLERIREGLDRHRASGAHMDRPYYLGLLAEVLGADRQRELARQTLEEALAQVDNTRHFFQEAELLRLLAEFELEAGNDVRARELLRKSLAAAETQRNKIAQLRAERALEGLTRGTRAHAGHLRALRELYASFTEGHDAPDLREAAALLA
jgi:DNA-binding winged helix-turn-helix (wHTH) protein/tetratricopeptide (TPR) repeat protein